MYKKMLLWEHLKEFREHLLKGLFSIFIGTFLVMFHRKIIFDYILFAPAKSNFITYRLFQLIGTLLNTKLKLTLKNNLTIQNRQMLGQFNTFVCVSFIGGIILAFPYIFYEFWCFIRTGLSGIELFYSKIIIIFSSILFVLGLFFGYYILCPMAIQFGETFKVSNLPENIFDLSDYISIVTSLTISMGFLFLFPIAVFFLTKLELINTSLLRMYRKHAFILILIISAAITPSDLLSMFIAMFPLLILYEISIYTTTILN